MENAFERESCSRGTETDSLSLVSSFISSTELALRVSQIVEEASGQQ